MKTFTLMSLAFLFTASFASATPDTELNSWGHEKRAALFSGCESLTRIQWLKRYSRIEVEYIEKIESIESIKNYRIDPTIEFWDVGKVVFPQDLPDIYPMRGVFLSCFEFFDRYREAETPRSAERAIKRLESCFERNYRSEIPTIVPEYLGCLKKLK